MTSTRRSAAARWVLLAAALAPATLAAQGGLFEREFDDEAKPWVEIEAQLPAYPRDGNLIAFDGGPAGHRFQIDAPSLSVGADGVVRYTLVVRAAGGAMNVTFEGIRCATREQKLYAVGRPDGRWVRAREPAWRRIENREFNRHHAVLYSEFFCPERGSMTSVARIVATLKREAAPLR